jgi:ubiquinone/menaquinone biosynthesis C-methylase UbiE
MKFEASGPNAEQITYWNEQMGSKWVALESRLESQISSFGLAVMSRAELAPGQRVLDVGCGCGQTSVQLGERVGAAGLVVGVDVSTAMIERARARACEAQLRHVRFENADAQTFPLPPASFDLAFSRFGIMFFSDPTGAFANLRGALTPGGRLAFVCWQRLDRNPWMQVPLAATAQHAPLPEPLAPGAPGPFSFADADRVQGILESAGFSEIAFESEERELLLGGSGSLEQAVDFTLQLGPAAAALRQAGDAVRASVVGSIRDALAPYTVADGVRMPSASWIVTARA